MTENREVMDRLNDVGNQVDLVLGEVRNALQRLTALEGRAAELEERIGVIEHDSGRPPPLAAPPPAFRAPMASITSEERSALAVERGRSLDSIRAAVEHQTEKQTPMLEATARASKLTPYALAAGLIVSAFVSGLMQNCHIVGGH